MIKKGFLLALLAAAAAATPPPLVEEDFGGSRFPPQGWAVTGYGSDWGWSNPGGYADGYATTVIGDEAKCSIMTPSFRLDRDQRIRVIFRYVATGYGSAPRQYDISIDGGGQIISYGLPETSGWEYYEWVSSPVTAKGRYKIHWFSMVYGPYNSGTTILRLDDVEIGLYNVAVGPTSLGRVKALYY
ncbi:MAG: hypothetical protein PVH29_05145 [Candidatus Zixiibacteriota bacterium]|jgi:hypothetical protein